MAIEDLKYWLASLGKSAESQALVINDMLDNAVFDKMSKEDRKTCLEALDFIGMERKTLSTKQRLSLCNAFAPCHRNYNVIPEGEDEDID